METQTVTKSNCVPLFAYPDTTLTEPAAGLLAKLAILTPKTEDAPAFSINFPVDATQ